MSRIIKKTLSAEHKQLFDSLLEKEEITSEVILDSDADSDSETDESFRAKITLLKNPSQSLKPAAIKSNLNDWKVLQSIYEKISVVIEKLDLSS